MKHIAIIKGSLTRGTVVAAVALEDEKVVDADGKAARGPAQMKIIEKDINPLTGRPAETTRFYDYEAVYEPWMNGEAWRDCIMVEDTEGKASTGWTYGPSGFVPPRATS